MSHNQPREIKIFWKLLALTLVIFCCSANAHKNSLVAPNLKFSYEKVKRLPLGSSQTEAQVIFGPPTKVYKDKHSDEVRWVYIEGTEILHRSQRLGLSFSGPGLKLVDIYYYPLPPDKVALVNGLQAEFPKAKFKTVEPSNCGEHYTLNEGFDYDYAIGITFKKDKAGRVTDMNLSTPLTDEQRATASEPTGCPDKTKRSAEFSEITPALK